MASDLSKAQSPDSASDRGNEPKRIQGKLWSIVLERHNALKDTDIEPSQLKKYLSVIALDWRVRYWFILHDNDYLETGEKKRDHYHIVLQFPRRQDKSVLLKRLPFVFDCNSDMLGVDKITSLPSMLRYLVHLDEIDNKYRYSFDCVKSNFYDVFLDAVSSDDVEEVNTAFIISAVYDIGNDPAELARRLGASNYVKYRFLIKDLLNSCIDKKRDLF